MKALIISEDEKVYTTLDEILKNAAYDTIIYKWLLKALDNIEEIRPDLIVVSSSEYPRHWKTLVQFVKSGIGGDNVEIYLYEATPVSDEDQEKASVLGISGCFSDFDDFAKMVIKQEQEPQAIAEEEADAVEADAETEADEGLEAVEEPKEESSALQEETTEEATEETIPNTGHFMFTHPESQNFISGKYFDYNGKSLSCSFFDEEDLDTVREEMTIDSFSFFDSINVRRASVIIKNIMRLSPSNTFVIVEIKDIYEEN